MKCNISKIIIVLLSVLFILTITTSCKSVSGIFGKSSAKIEQQSQKIDTIDEKLIINNKDKLDQIGLFSYGVSYTLNSVTNKSPEVDVAKDLNLRISSLATTPAIEQMKVMQQTIDNLLSELESERAKGKKQLSQFDYVINKIQIDSGVLLNKKDLEIKKYMALSADTALKTDQLQQELKEYTGLFGLKAVAKGSWQFIKTSMWFLLGGGALFLILRVFASMNPIAGAAFSIFNIIGGYIIRAINIIVPKAIEFGGYVATSAYNNAKLLLTKIIDSIQVIKEIEKKTGKDITLKELLTELEKTLDKSEKEVISKIKADLGY